MEEDDIQEDPKGVEGVEPCNHGDRPSARSDSRWDPWVEMGVASPVENWAEWEEAGPYIRFEY